MLSLIDRCDRFKILTSVANLSFKCEISQLKRYAMATLTRHDFRSIIYYNFARGLSKEECFKKISEVRTVERWYLQFRQGSFVLEDQPHTGRPLDVATPESVDAVWETITLNRRIIYKQL